MFEHLPLPIFRNFFVSLKLKEALNFSATCKAYRSLLFDTLEHAIVVFPKQYPCGDKNCSLDHTCPRYFCITRYTEELDPTLLFSAFFVEPGQQDPAQVRFLTRLGAQVPPVELGKTLTQYTSYYLSKYPQAVTNLLLSSNPHSP